MIAATNANPKPRTVGQDPLLSVNEAASALRVGKSVVYGLVNSGRLPFCKVGGSIKIWFSDLDAYAKRNTSRPS
jgi:excisionase family DNA binding protein